MVDGEAMTATAIAAPRTIGWLRSPGFDLGFVLGVAGLALASGAVVVRYPALFMPVVLADLWLLGYHHVIATYTRLCFDRASLKQHGFLLIGLPVIVLAAVLCMVAGLGLWSIVSLYFYWQWFHYARQSWGVSRAYRGKAEHPVDGDKRLDQVIFYLVPLWGVLHRSAQAPDAFLGLPIHFVPMPEFVATTVGVASLTAVAWFAATRVQAWREGRLPLAHTFYMATHFVIFYVAYVWIEDTSSGWLVANIWHNAQYIGFVWLYNSRKFARGVDPAARFLSTISQPKHIISYMAVCLAISTTLYLSIASLAVLIVTPIVIYQAINFHHYVVDSVIWKLRKPALRSDLGLAR
jgi:hypothetical protein